MRTATYKKQNAYCHIKRILAIIVTMMLLFSIVASASTPTGSGGDIASSKLVTGTKKLLNDASMTGMILAPLLAVGFLIYFFIRKNSADEMDQKKWNSRIWVTLASLVGVELAGMLVGLIIQYYA